MATNDVVGAISELWRFPVKSMQGERTTSLEIDEAGVVGDRAFAIVDATTGKVASAKHIASWPGLLDCQAESTEPVDGAAPTVWMGLPDGTVVTSDRDDVDAVLSAFFGRSGRLARTAPDDFTVDMYHPDLDGLDPEGHRDVVVETRLGAPLYAQLGLPSPLPPGSFLDLFPVTVMTTSTHRRAGTGRERLGGTAARDRGRRAAAGGDPRDAVRHADGGPGRPAAGPADHADVGPAQPAADPGRGPVSVRRRLRDRGVVRHGRHR